MERHRGPLLIAGALVCLGLAGCGSTPSSAEVEKTTQGLLAGAAAPAYNIEQAISDRAQETTIAFDALGFLTGTLGSDSFFPPGKLADFWGFQYLRDNDPSQMGHNTDFLTSASLNMLSVLAPAQRGQLIALATSQVDSINQYGYKRFVLMKAFRRLLEGDLPAGAAGLDEEAVKAYSAALYALDGEISFERAQVMGPMLAALSSDQKAYLDAMVGKGMSSWPKVDEPADLKGLNRDQKVAVMTYAGDMFSWYAGSLDADVYFCPERHGTYFGSFYLKDAPAVGNPGYSIDTTLTGNLGTALIQKLSSTQAALITGLVDIQRPYLTEIVDVRGEVSAQLRKFQSGRSADSAAVADLMKTYGELDGEIVYHLATNFAKVGQSLTASQRTELMTLRTRLLGDLATPAGAYLFSQPIAVPDIPNTDFLFGVAAEDPHDPTDDPMDSPTPTFPDIASSPYGAAIEAMAARGVIGGYTDGTFHPTENVKRMQFAKMVVKTLNYPVSPADTCSFADVPEGEDAGDPLYPRAYVAVCAAHGITEGFTSATFGPYGTITRAQLIAMVARAAGLGEPLSGYVAPFADFSSAHYPWARRAAYAGLLHGLQGVGAAYDFWAPASRGECAQLLWNLANNGATPPTSVGVFPGTVLLGRPTNTSAVLSILPDTALEISVEYGAATGTYTMRSDRRTVNAEQPLELSLSGLTPNAECFYRLRYRPVGGSDFLATAEQSFRTQRSPGSTFTFAVEADPHVDVDGKMVPELFRAELASVKAADPDFLIDLGDTFLGDKLSAADYATVEAQYVNVRDYFGLIGPSVPLFLANGNHEGESGWLLDGTGNNLAVWAETARTTYYPNPFPDGFYTGDTAQDPFVGPRESYYAWQWGDALFVVLDPYWHTTVNPKQSGDLWDYTLGEAQYRWLATSLRASTAKYKFVFSHHILGDVRGGVEWAGLYEWGGSGKNGNYQFDQMRPGWDLPLHQLLVETGVTIFFQGHDHFFVRQEQDGVVYQEVPQPATPGGDPQNMAHEYAYRSGVILASPGHLEVTVSPAQVKVDYVHSSTGAGDSSGRANGEVVYSYAVGG